MGRGEEKLDRLPELFERYTAELASGLRSFEGAIALRGARYVEITSVPNAAGQSAGLMAQNGQGRLVGWSLRATGGAVTVLIRDSADADNGRIVGALELAAETSDSQSFGDGVSFTQGLWVAVARPANGLGQLQGSLFVGAVG